MTVDLQLGRVVFDGDGVTRNFTFSFKVFEATDIRLIRVDGAELAHELLYQYDFDIILYDPPLMGGEVVFPREGTSVLPLARGERLVISRAVKAVQDTLYPEHSPIFQRLIETSFDKTTVLIQQLEEGLSRSVQVPISLDITPESLMSDLFGARDAVVRLADDAAASASEATEQVTLAKHHADTSGAFAVESNGHATISLGHAETSLAHANTSQAHATTSDEHRDEARQWATHPVDTPIEHDAQDNPLYSAKHWAIKTAQKEQPGASIDIRGGIRVGAGLDIEDVDKLHVDVGDGLAIDATTGKVVVDAGDGLVFDDTGKLVVEHNHKIDEAERYRISRIGNIEFGDAALHSPNYIPTDGRALRVAEYPELQKKLLDGRLNAREAYASPYKTYWSWYNGRVYARMPNTSGEYPAYLRPLIYVGKLKSEM